MIPFWVPCGMLLERVKKGRDSISPTASASLWTGARLATGGHDWDACALLGLWNLKQGGHFFQEGSFPLLPRQPWPGPYFLAAVVRLSRQPPGRKRD